MMIEPRPNRIYSRVAVVVGIFAGILLTMFVTIALTVPPTLKSSQNLTTEGEVESYKQLEVVDFNRVVEKAAQNNEAWTKDVMQVALKFVPEMSIEEEGRRSRIIEVAKADIDNQPGVIVVIITDDGFADDSVRGQKHRVELKKGADGAWKLINAWKAWTCQPNRGHQNYSTQLCS
ncbi:MAG TPA: hypothetical protein DDZ80_01740 [Cyanobacteria bacterium UBA8803]|nr:hypothetical protein [Cyanobacteria bacterium UBA9273]HBL57318.1 hypothetical protein [Cyanobacteria bacterium UBA8803]